MNHLERKECEFIDDKGGYIVQPVPAPFSINNDAIIHHSVGNLIKWKLTGFKFYSTNHSPLRLYYRTRNRFQVRYLYKKYYRSFFRSDMINLLKELLKIIASKRMYHTQQQSITYLNLWYASQRASVLDSIPDRQQTQARENMLLRSVNER